MAKRGPQAAAKRKREGDKRAKREAKQERRARRAEERAQTRETPPSESTSGEAQ